MFARNDGIICHCESRKARSNPATPKGVLFDLSLREFAVRQIRGNLRVRITKMRICKLVIQSRRLLRSLRSLAMTIEANFKFAGLLCFATLRKKPASCYALAPLRLFCHDGFAVSQWRIMPSLRANKVSVVISLTKNIILQIRMEIDFAYGSSKPVSRFAWATATLVLPRPLHGLAMIMEANLCNFVIASAKHEVLRKS